MPVQGAGGGYGEARLNPTRATRARSEARPGYGLHAAPSAYNFRDGEPGNSPGNYYEPAEGSAQGSARRVRDAGGSVRGDNEGGRHFAAGEVESIKADLQWLLSATRALIATINDPRYSRGQV